MPITLRITDGILAPGEDARVFAALTDAFLDHHGLSGNSFLAPNVIGEVDVIPPSRTFAGGRPTAIAIVELTVPTFALSSRAEQVSFIRAATDIVYAAAGGRLARERIFVNVVYAVDGLWGIGGDAYLNADLLAAVATARAAA